MVPCRLALARETLLLRVPAATESAGDFAARELVDVLAHPRAGRIGRRGDVAVMPAVVLDAEMAVGRHGRDDARHPALEVRLLVAELVRRVDADAAVEPGGQRQRQQRGPAHVVRAGEPGDRDQHGEMHRHREDRQPAVVRVGLELRDQFLGRVAGVFTEQPVEQRGAAVEQHQRDDERPLAAVQRVQPDAAQGDEREEQRADPQVALAVGVGDLAFLRVLHRKGFHDGSRLGGVDEVRTLGTEDLPAHCSS